MTTPPQLHPDISAAPPARLKVLLAEDEPLQQKVLERILSLAGYEVHTARDGDEALARLIQEPFHLLVTDWDMPGMDGTTLCRKLRESPRESYLYILMLTGHSATSDVVKGLDAGADDYIRKPAEAAELLARVNAGRRIIELERSLSAAHEKILRLSIMDPLLETYNRRYLEDKLPEEVARAVRYKRPLSLVMADIDHFKTVNDERGHLAGDQVLRAFARHLLVCVRQPVDWVARYGGEEFAIVLPETTLDRAMLVAEKIRQGCAAGLLGHCPTHITASFGVASLPEELGAADNYAHLLLATADSALYQSKQRGRNRVSSSAFKAPS